MLPTYPPLSLHNNKDDINDIKNALHTPHTPPLPLLHICRHSPVFADEILRPVARCTSQNHPPPKSPST